MKTKKHYYVVLLACLLVSLCLLCFGIFGVKEAYADEASETPNTEVSVVPETSTAVKESDSEVEDYNNKIKSWLSTVFGGAGIALDTLLIAILSKKNKQSVAVTVNDEQTQNKLDSLNTEYCKLEKLVVDMFQLNKGTLEVLLTLYSDNKSLDENIRGTIKAISLNSEDIIKDVSDILDADKHKLAKTALQNISNIVLG